MVNEHSEYIPATVVQARYAISHVTLWRWIRSASLGFPQPVIVNRRRLFRRADLEAWECTRIRSSPSGSVRSPLSQGEAA
jgi:predicted DNA-binding transcriptional regulator AlpA